MYERLSMEEVANYVAEQLRLFYLINYQPVVSDRLARQVRVVDSQRFNQEENAIAVVLANHTRPDRLFTETREITVERAAFEIPKGDNSTHGHPATVPAVVIGEGGAVAVDWNFVEYCRLYLCGEWERDADIDHLGRVEASRDPRSKSHIETPVFNFVAASLAAAHLNISIGNVRSLITPPRLLVSHDCDLLSSADPWSQLNRIARMSQNISAGEWGSLKRILSFLWDNRFARVPNDCFSGIQRAIDIERSAGVESSFYLLNGTYGRYGRRSPRSLLSKAVELIGDHGAIGLHYHPDTLDNDELLKRCKEDLERLASRSLVQGRAHYLKYRQLSDLRKWAEVGIVIDESAGYSTRPGFRYGIGSAFQPISTEDKYRSFLEIPLTLMDTNYSLTTAEALSQKLAKVGGVMSLLFHNDLVDSREYPDFQGKFTETIRLIRQSGLVPGSAREEYGRFLTAMENIETQEKNKSCK